MKLMLTLLVLQLMIGLGYSPMAISAPSTGFEYDTPAIVAFSSTGASGRRIASYRAPRPTVLLTADPAVARRMSLVWGIRSLIDREVTDHDTVPIMAEEAVRRLGIGDEQDSIVVVCGFPFGVPGTTNSIRVTPLGRKDIP